MNSRLSKMNKNLASMHDEKEKANAMAKKVKMKIIIWYLKKMSKGRIKKFVKRISKFKSYSHCNSAEYN